MMSDSILITCYHPDLGTASGPSFGQHYPLDKSLSSGLVLAKIIIIVLSTGQRATGIWLIEAWCAENLLYPIRSTTKIWVVGQCYPPDKSLSSRLVLRKIIIIVLSTGQRFTGIWWIEAWCAENLLYPIRSTTQIWVVGQCYPPHKSLSSRLVLRKIIIIVLSTGQRFTGIWWIEAWCAENLLYPIRSTTQIWVVGQCYPPHKSLSSRLVLRKIIIIVLSTGQRFTGIWWIEAWCAENLLYPIRSTTQIWVVGQCYPPHKSLSSRLVLRKIIIIVLSTGQRFTGIWWIEAWCAENLLHPISSTTQIWVVMMCHQYGISLLVSHRVVLWHQRWHKLKI